VSRDFIQDASSGGAAEAADTRPCNHMASLPRPLQWRRRWHALAVLRIHSRIPRAAPPEAERL
jgi:hypothetical protein